MKTKVYTNDEVMKNKMDYAKSLSASTTVWTNHGEPQEIDKKYAIERCDALDKFHGKCLGVALQTEAETVTEEVRQMMIRHGISETAAKLILAKVATQQPIPLPEAETDATRHAGDLIAKYDHVVAQRDELLAALKRIALEPQGQPTASHAEVLRAVENIAREAIANASK